LGEGMVAIATCRVGGVKWESWASDLCKPKPAMITPPHAKSNV
jgi:hypothetical protein